MPFINDMLADTHKPDPAATRETPLQALTGQSLSASRFLFDPDTVMATLRSRILGQEAVLQSVEAALKVIKADIGDPRRPLHIALLMGQTGVGKTELVRVLAEALQGKPDAFCRIDMNTLAQDHYAAAITGAPPGYVGSKEGTTLLDSEHIHGSFSRPGIVLFDEIEKAGTEVIRSLLNVLDNGQLRLSAGSKTIDFRNCLIFMTSNLGAAAIRQYQDRSGRGWRRWFTPSKARQRRRMHRLMESAFHARFDPEFINRIDRICLFDSLGLHQLDGLIDLELQKLNQRLARKGYQVELDASARCWLSDQGFDARYGARAMTRAFRQAVEVGVAEAMLEDRRERDVPSQEIRFLLGRCASEGQDSQAGHDSRGGLRFQLNVIDPVHQT